MSFFLPICLPVYLSIFLSVDFYICLTSTNLSACLYVYFSICLQYFSICRPVWPSICLHFCLSLFLPFYLPVLSVYLYWGETVVVGFLVLAREQVLTDKDCIKTLVTKFPVLTRADQSWFRQIKTIFRLTKTSNYLFSLLIHFFFFAMQFFSSLSIGYEKPKIQINNWINWITFDASDFHPCTTNRLFQAMI